ncbi:MAG: hypothetical protein M1450_03650 [Patescibacteria group bacterium]|nr:hypothetical protein [Actinomycetota bacterium]MCL5970567.1 hypothetical protein [Patescibacteria group bacterium]
MRKNQRYEPIAQISYTTPSPTSYKQSSPEPTSVLKPPIAYTSQKLGIRFSYRYKPYGEDKKFGFLIKEVDNKIYVYGEDEDYTKGQSVEVFGKERDETLVEAISKQILKNYSSKNCLIRYVDKNEDSLNFSPAKYYPNNYRVAIIYYTDLISAKPTAENLNKCPQLYTFQGTTVFFLSDVNHPEKFLFFQIGNYYIPIEDQKAGRVRAWQDSIEFIN